MRISLFVATLFMMLTAHGSDKQFLLRDKMNYEYHGIEDQTHTLDFAGRQLADLALEYTLTLRADVLSSIREMVVVPESTDEGSEITGEEGAEITDEKLKWDIDNIAADYIRYLVKEDELTTSVGRVFSPEFANMQTGFMNEAERLGLSRLYLNRADGTRYVNSIGRLQTYLFAYANIMDSGRNVGATPLRETTNLLSELLKKEITSADKLLKDLYRKNENAKLLADVLFATFLAVSNPELGTSEERARDLLELLDDSELTQVPDARAHMRIEQTIGDIHGRIESAIADRRVTYSALGLSALIGFASMDITYGLKLALYYVGLHYLNGPVHGVTRQIGRLLDRIAVNPVINRFLKNRNSQILRTGAQNAITGLKCEVPLRVAM